MATTEVPKALPGEEGQSVPLALVRTGTTFIILYSTCATLLFVLTCFMLLRHSHAHERRRRLPMLLILCLAMVLGLLGSILNTVSTSVAFHGDVGEDAGPSLMGAYSA